MGAAASEIAAFLGRPLAGADVVVTHVQPVATPAPGSLVFAGSFSDALLAVLASSPETLVLAAPEYEGKLPGPHIITPTPRLDYARVVQRFLAPPRALGVAPTAVVAATARLGKNVTVGHFSVIGERVEIGDDTEIRHHVVIADNCRIGRDCLIKSHTVIGEEGFGFDFDETGTPIRLPHLGHVLIGDGVEIGAANVIARGTMAPTVIGDYVKTDDCVFIAHNCTVGEKTVITAGVEISGSVHIGKKVWIGPQSCVINKVSIGDGAFVGIGAVITKPVEPGVVVAGNPARVLPKRVKEGTQVSAELSP